MESSVGRTEQVSGGGTAPVAKFCSGCGRQRTAEDKFCAGCGKKLD